MLDNVGLRYPHRASGAKAPRTLRPLPLLRFTVSATGGAHLCSIQYYLRFWLSSCRTSLAVSALRIMRYCLIKSQPFTGKRKISLLFFEKITKEILCFSFRKRNFGWKGEFEKQKQEKLCKIWKINDDETNCILTKLKRHKIIKKLSKSVDKRGILGYNNTRRWWGGQTK